MEIKWHHINIWLTMRRKSKQALSCSFHAKGKHITDRRSIIGFIQVWFELLYSGGFADERVTGVPRKGRQSTEVSASM